MKGESLSVKVPKRNTFYTFVPQDGWVRSKAINEREAHPALNYRVTAHPEWKDICDSLPARAVTVGGYLFLKGEFYHLHDGSQASPKKKTELRIELRRVAMESTFGDYCFNDSKGLYLYECTLGRKTLSNSHYPTLVNCELGGGSLEGADQVLLFKSGNLLEGIYKPKRAILIGQDPGHMDWESGDVVILTTRVKRGLSKKVQEVHQVSSSFLNKVQRHLEESGEKMRSTDAKGIRKLASEAREDLLDMCGKYTDVVNDWPPNLN